MIIQKIPTDQINPAAYNPRKDLQPGDLEYEKLKRSMQEFGSMQVKKNCFTNAKNGSVSVGRYWNAITTSASGVSVMVDTVEQRQSIISSIWTSVLTWRW